MTEISNFIPGVKRFRSGTYNSEFTFPPELAILENEYERKGSSRLMKRIDFENGTVTGNILGAALPMLVAQILNLLYNIVDRIYIARIPGCGTAALGAVGLCFPLIVILSAFANLFGSGGAPLFSIYRGKKETEQANRIMNTSFTMVCVSATFLMTIGLVFARPPSGALRRVCRCFSLCISIHDALSHRHAAFHDRSRHESFYQRTGIFPCWYVLRRHRRSCQSAP